MRGQHSSDRRTEPPRRIYAFIDSVVEAEERRPRSRMSLQFDAVDANAFDAGAAAVDDDAALVLARVSSTPNRLRELFGVELPKESDWFEIELNRARSMPRGWLLPFNNGYTPLPPLNAVAMRPLPETSELVARLDRACVAPNAKSLESSAPLEELLSAAMPSDLRVTALDVGHAACVMFSNGSRPFGYFDVGAPMFFNQRSFPRHLDHRFATDGFVILSHWDFDHFALAIRYPQLRSLNWFAPQQPVGPNTARFQKSLGARLKFVTGDVSIGGMLLRRCTGTSPRDRNATGYAVRIDRKDVGILLPGDADYQWIPPVIARGTNRIVLPHHGAAGSPPPTPNSTANPIAIRMRIRLMPPAELVGEFGERPRMEIRLVLVGTAAFTHNARGAGGDYMATTLLTT